MEEPQPPRGEDLPQPGCKPILDWFQSQKNYHLVVHRSAIRASALLKNSTQGRFDTTSVSVEDIVQTAIARLLARVDSDLHHPFRSRNVTLTDLSNVLAMFAKNVVREVMKKRAVRTKLATQLRRKLEERNLTDYIREDT